MKLNGEQRGSGLQKLASFETTLKGSTLVKTHSTTKDTQEWMKWSFLANYRRERGRGGAFCASHKQSFLPLSPAIERDTLARRDGWSGEEQSAALAVVQLTSCLVLQTSLMTSLTLRAQNVIFLQRHFSAAFLRPGQKRIQTCEICAHFYLVWIKSGTLPFLIDLESILLTVKATEAKRSLTL